MFKIKKRKPFTPRKLNFTRQSNNDVVIGWNPKNPPQVFFDTNVLLGLNPEGIAALKTLQKKREFIYRYSMLNFVELASHLGDEPSTRSRNPFRKYQAALFKIVANFDLKPLPSPEMVFMKAIGLYNFMDPRWNVDVQSWDQSLPFMASANNLAELRRAQFHPEHYKKLREEDGRMFLRFIEEAKIIGKIPAQEGQPNPEWGNYLGKFYNFIVSRASMGKIFFSSLSRFKQNQVIRFFKGPGGEMFRFHFSKILEKTLNYQRGEDANDFYDMLQLLLLRDENLIFVTDENLFQDYDGGPQHHRVLPWKEFMQSSTLR